MAISKINSLSLSNVAKVNSLAKGSMAKLNSLTNVTFANTRSLALDGVNDHVTADGIFNDIDVSVGTVSAWAKLDSTSINAILFKFDVDTNNQVSIAYLNGSSKLRFQYKAGGTQDKIDHSVSIENDGNHHHFMITWDKSADQMKGYIDGSQVGTTQTGLGTWSGTVNAFKIGMNSIANNGFWAGHIDQFSMFTSVVSPSTLYNGGTVPDLTGTSNMIGWWQMEEGSGTTVADSSGTGNTATLVNGPTFSTDIV